MTPAQYRVSGRTAIHISESLESGIRTGELGPGAVLPSVRRLAAELGVAAGTTGAAYKLLRDRGLVEARGRSGTRVSAQPPSAARSSSPPVDAHIVDLASGQPDPRLLPALGVLAAAAQHGPAAAPPDFVLPELRALARERLGTDGVFAEALTVTSGGLDAIYRVLSSSQLRSGDRVAIEDPGWPNALDLVAALGLRAHPVALDVQGIVPRSLETALRAGARAVLLTNRAQNPTGTSMSAPRARELRGVLERYPQTMLIEDDHAAELARIPLIALAGATTSWAFIRSTSKPYGPDLRVALVAGDEATIARVEGRMRVGSGWVSTMLQRLIVELWGSAEVADAIAQAADTYDDRRQQLITQLDQRGVTATGASGLNVWVPVTDETATVTSLLQAGWAVAPGARFRQTSAPGVRITVSALTNATIPRLADDLAVALTPTPIRRYTT